ncbi:hypothetical protein BWI93_05315 [Siphonobacter sp. BAB-5385]|uniref:hypothetical protein n=1 Tax=Siphonobacter sp. BAB-5385 TaxID=1864822 RepID=UPI000B9E4AFE|nr:hypothetical protein [Siphonobacter sp. BAB-5385]OZI09166.1 hypothetical protein BWI93_05315 [Siphonobacter sp. BAB-5385]
MEQPITPLVFTDEQFYKVNILKKENPNEASGILDLLRLRNSQCKQQEAANVLDTIILGFVNSIGLDDPFLDPVEIENPSMVFKGNKQQGVGDVQCFRTPDGTNYSIWSTNNFWARWEFLRSGALLIGYSATPPINIRLDLEAMGVKMHHE